jgi:hypothetical protein
MALHRKKFTSSDVAEWARILTAYDTQSTIERYVSSPCQKPSFVLLSVLRRDIRDVRSLKMLLHHFWSQLKPRPESEIENGTEALSTQLEILILGYRSREGALSMRAPPFLALRHLLRHSRLVWPSAVVSIAYMVLPFIDLILGTSPAETRKLGRLMHWRLCKIFNRFLHILALPASTGRLKKYF